MSIGDVPRKREGRGPAGRGQGGRFGAGNAAAGGGDVEQAIANNPRFQQMVRTVIERTLFDPSDSKSARIGGTGVTEAGVRRLMQLLSKRAASEGGGANAAKRLKQFITRPGDPRSMVHGANIEQIEKLVRIAAEPGDAEDEAVAGRGQVRREPPSDDPSDFEARISALEATVAKLSAQVARLTGEQRPARSSERAAPRQQAPVAEEPEVLDELGDSPGWVGEFVPRDQG